MIPSEPSPLIATADLAPGQTIGRQPIASGKVPGSSPSETNGPAVPSKAATICFGQQLILPSDQESRTNPKVCFANEFFEHVSCQLLNGVKLCISVPDAKPHRRPCDRFSVASIKQPC